MPDQTDAYLPVVLDAWDALASAIRGDWTRDGRSIRSAVNDITESIRAGERPTYAQMCAVMDVCPERRSWTEYCDEYDQTEWNCAHTVAALTAPYLTQEGGG